ncbi:unnamed protein product [Pieris macdunnoughi]|uniref:Uncharacterized protein n=1 Tax=Pieris macdunnoughi TaxID=345717 RepID=A0A821MQV7_9NEOP|nr:unnamed protein product [Pieris macdunnoughi]
MTKKLLKITCLLLLIFAVTIEGKKLSRSRGSGRGSGRKTNYKPQPAPTSLSYPQASAPKPSLFGWQEKPAQKTQISQSHQSKPGNQAPSYPASNTGLSGAGSKQTQQQEHVQRSNVPSQQTAPRPESPSQTNSHAYPASNGLSGNSGAGSSYPQGSGLSGSNGVPSSYNSPNKPQYPPNNNLQNNHPPNNVGNNYQAAPPPYTPYGNNNHQGPPPPYSNYGHGYSGYGGHGGPGYSPQMPGYFGSYTNKGFGGVSRSGSTLAGVGLAGAGIGTVLTGLALWNMARSTGHHHHTVIYDNRGQPIAVAAENGTVSAEDPILRDLVNCTLTISSINATEVIAIPCSIATSFTPDANVKDDKVENANNDTKCTITVVTKDSKEFMTTIPCSILLNTAAQNNVTEPPNVLAETALNDTLVETALNDTLIETNITDSNSPKALKLSSEDEIKDFTVGLNCTSSESGEIRDPINPCFSVKDNLTVIPLISTTKSDLLPENK